MMYAEEIVGSEDEKMSMLMREMHVAPIARLTLLLLNTPGEASSSSVNSSLVVSCSKGALVSDSTDL